MPVFFAGQLFDGAELCFAAAADLSDVCGTLSARNDELHSFRLYAMRCNFAS